MAYENEKTDIQKVVKEQIEMEFYEERNDGTSQFCITYIDGVKVSEEDIILISLKKDLGTMMITGYAGAMVYDQMESGNYLGKLEVFFCKKKKGLFGKESLKVIETVKRTYHRSALESGEEELFSLTDVRR